MWYDKLAVKLATLNGIEYLSAENFEERLKAADMIGKDDFDRHRRTLLKFFRMAHEPTEFVSDADTHHLLYVTALKPGWYGVGQKEDIPKNAAYAGRYGKTCVWVMPGKHGDLDPAHPRHTRYPHVQERANRRVARSAGHSPQVMIALEGCGWATLSKFR